MSILKIKWKTVCAQLSLRQSVHIVFRRIVLFLAVLQTTSNITSQSSNLHLLTSWSDPSNYISSSVIVIIASILTLFILVVILVKIWTSHERLVPKHPSLPHQYFKTVFSYIKVTGKYFVLVPLIRSCIMELMKQTNMGLQIISWITLILFICGVYPLLLYLDDNPPLLLENSNRTLTFFNAEIIFNMFRLILALTTFSNPPLIVSFSMLYCIMFWIALIQNPIFLMNFLKIQLSVISLTIYSCLNRLAELIVPTEEGNIVIEIVAIGTFILAVIYFVKWRMKNILDKELSVYQIKLLIFMIYHIQDNLDLLSIYIINHHKQCIDPLCTCNKVVEHLANKTQDPSKDEVWFQFVDNLIASTYKLEKILKLPKTEMEHQSEQYSQLAFQQTQIALFQRKKVNRAFLLLSDFRSHLQDKKLNHLWNPLRFSILCYHMQKMFKEEKKINPQAKVFAEIQVQVSSFFGLLLKTGEKGQLFWKQLDSLEPDSEIILNLLSAISKNNDKIKDQYKELTEAFPNTANVIDPVLRNFLEDLYSFSKQEEKLFWGVSLDGKHRNVKRLDENMELYSEDSQTPMFLMSAEHHNFGTVSKPNFPFRELKVKNLIEGSSVDDLLSLPQLLDSHHNQIKEAIQSNQMMIELPRSYFLNSQGDLYAVQLLIQIFPFLENGLKYAVFVKSMETNLRLLLVKNKVEILYKSSSLESLYNSNKMEQSVLRTLMGQDDESQAVNQDVFQNWTLRIVKTQIVGQNEYQYVQVVQTIRQKEYEIQQKEKEPDNKQLREKSLKYKKERSIVQSPPTIKSFNINDVIEEQTQNMETMKKTKIIKDIFIFLFLSRNQRGGKIQRKITGVSIILALVLILLFFSCLLIKNINRNYYSNVFNTSNNYTKMMKNLGQLSLKLKLINLNTTKYSRLYQQMVQANNLYQQFQDSMTLLATELNSDIVNPTINSLTLHSNGSFTPESLPLFHAIPDVLQRSLTNLQSTPLINFSFPFSLDYLTPPLTSTQVYFYTFLTNSIYFVIPFFNEFHLTTMMYFLSQKFKRTTPIMIVSPFIMGITLLGLFCFLCCHRKIVNLDNYSHRFLEQINSYIIQKNLKKCRSFQEKYKFQLENLVNQTELTRRNSNNQHNETNVTAFTSRLQSFNSNIVISEEPKVQEESGRSLQVPRRRRKKQTIFKNTNYKCIILVYFIVSIPYFVIPGAFIAVEKKQNEASKLSSDMLYGSGMIESDFTLIELYALHFGVYNYQLQQYLSISEYLVKLIYKNYFLTQQILQLSQSDTNAKAVQSLKKIQYANICELEQQGHFDYSDLQFQGRGNYETCSSISGGILTRGFTPTLVHYLDQANKLFTQNVYTIMYPPAQKMQYLTSSFFTDTVRVLNYINMIFSQSISVGNEELEQLYNYTYSIYLICILVMFFYTLTLFFCLRSFYLQTIKRYIDQMSTIFTLISYRTIQQNTKLRESFVEKSNDLKELK